MSKRRRIESPADTGAGFWAKSHQMLTSARAHFWLQFVADGYSRSSCGLVFRTETLRSADDHTPRCMNCESLERGK